MTQFYVVEIQKSNSGEYGHNVFWEYDEDAQRAQLKAEAKYHTVLAAAAVSNLAEHAAIMFSSEGFPMMHQCYKHDPGDAEPETVVEEEPETEKK